MSRSRDLLLGALLAVLIAVGAGFFWNNELQQAREQVFELNRANAELLLENAKVQVLREQNARHEAYIETLKTQCHENAHPVPKLPDDDAPKEGDADGDGIPDEEEETENIVKFSVFCLLGTVAYIFVIVVQEVREASGQATESRTVSDLVWYKIDLILSTDPNAKTKGLTILTLLLIVFGAVIFGATNGEGFTASLWNSWAFVSDPAAHIDEETSLERLVSFVLTVGGMFVFALLVGIVSEMVESKMDELNKGMSRVLEDDHTVILGWTDKTLAIVSEIAEANASDGGGVVVLLSTDDKEEQEQRYQDSELDFQNTSVVCRCGHPGMLTDLRRVAADKARCIIVLAEDEVNADTADARVVRVVLALQTLDLLDGLSGHVVAEVCQMQNKGLVNIVGGPMVETIVTEDILGRLMISCTRQPGLSSVYDSLLGFQGSEFYFKEWPDLVGRPFSELALMFEDAVPIGIRCRSEHQSEPGKQGCPIKVDLKPTGRRVLAAGEALLVLAEDDDTYEPLSAPAKVDRTMPNFIPPKGQVERILICGFRRDLKQMLKVIDEQVVEGSELHWMHPLTSEEALSRLFDADESPDELLQQLKLIPIEGDTKSRKDLEKLPLETFHSIMVLGDSTADDVESSDSESMACLLLIRDILRTRMEKMGITKNKRTQIISEILDQRTKALMQVAHISDYVLSNQHMSRVLAMVAEERGINGVVTEMLTSVGAELYVRASQTYVAVGEEASFFDIMARALRREEIALGYIAGIDETDHDKHAAGSAFINPGDKSVKRLWSPTEYIIVLSED